MEARKKDNMLVGIMNLILENSCQMFIIVYRPYLFKCIEFISVFQCVKYK